LTKFDTYFQRGCLPAIEFSDGLLVEDYRMWRPGCPPIRTRQRDVRRGYQGRKI